MVWGGISEPHKTSVHHVQGNLYDQRYRNEILRPTVIPVLPQIGASGVQQDDNAAPYRAQFVNVYLQQARVTRLDRPSYSRLGSPAWTVHPSADSGRPHGLAILQQAQVARMDWPSNSPDLNQTEHV